jgi:Holliday junction resolvase RusA-like endonuclease
MSGRVLALFRVEGRARTKGSLRPICTRSRDHKVYLKEETKDSAHWRRVVALECQRQQKAAWGALVGHAGPVEVRLAVYWARDLSEARGVAPGTVVPSHDTPYPTEVKMGDADKLARNVGDALEDSGLIRDDAQITDWCIAKRWAPAGSAGWAEILVQEADPLNAADPLPWMPGAVAHV